MVELKKTQGYFKKRGIALYAMAMLLLSVIVFSQNSSTLTIVYADSEHKNKNNSDNNNNNKNNGKNQSLINSIAEHVVNANLGANKATIQQILELIQTQIAQTSGQDKATKTINVINSIIALNPNGPLSQSLLSLAKQQASVGNTDAVIQAATQIAGLVSTGNDNVGQPLEQALTLSSLASPSSSQQASPTSAIPNMNQQQLSLQQQQLFMQQQQATPPARPPSPPPPLPPAASTLAALTNNTAPTATATGAAQTVNEGSTVTLDGSASQGNQLTYQWTQISGPPVTLSSPNSATTMFIAPSVSQNTALK